MEVTKHPNKINCIQQLQIHHTHQNALKYHIYTNKIKDKMHTHYHSQYIHSTKKEINRLMGSSDRILDLTGEM